MYNIPEGTEGTEYNCYAYVESFVKESVGLDDVEIESAHRVGNRRQPANSVDNADGAAAEPRPIIARCLRRKDRNRVLEAAPKALKGKDVGGNAVYVSDDVEPATREKHRQLVVKMKEFREKKWLAYIPWTVPRVLKYREKPDGPLKTYRI